jgi:hypothetical protein
VESLSPRRVCSRPGASDGDHEGSYRLWSADLWICPDCGHKIISGFGKGPIAEHYQSNYDDVLAQILANKLTKIQFKER